MFRVGVLIWALAATVLAGSFITVVLLVPQLDGKAMEYIPMAAALGAVVAIPLSWAVAKSIVSKI